jgi:hypothetical protein
MKANKDFLIEDLEFWAIIKLLSQKLGYSEKGIIIVPTMEKIPKSFDILNLFSNKVVFQRYPNRIR